MKNTRIAAFLVLVFSIFALIIWRYHASTQIDQLPLYLRSYEAKLQSNRVAADSIFSAHHISDVPVRTNEYEVAYDKIATVSTDGIAQGIYFWGFSPRNNVKALPAQSIEQAMLVAWTDRTGIIVRVLAGCRSSEARGQITIASHNIDMLLGKPIDKVSVSNLLPQFVHGSTISGQLFNLTKWRAERVITLGENSARPKKSVKFYMQDRLIFRNDLPIRWLYFEVGARNEISFIGMHSS